MRVELGRLRGRRAGATLIVVGGLHGNEPAGVAACRGVLGRIMEGEVAGEVVALAGNPAALAAGKRYLARDLNRQWTPERMAAARATEDVEAATLIALAEAIEGALARARGPVFALDLHTTSAEGFPFAIAAGREADRSFAREVPLPVILGLQENLGGTLTEYLAARGCVTLAVEGGQSASRAAAAHLEAAVVVGLAAAGVAELPEVGEARRLLRCARGELPHTIETVLRHPVGPGFRMEPGFANIERVAAGTLLARDDGGEIRAPFDGVVLMPLYQAQGSDGFFYGREIPP